MKNLFKRPTACSITMVAAVLATLAVAALAVDLAGVRADTSGPGASGYVWVDTNAPHPITTFDWIDATGGTPSDVGDADDASETVAMPFPFNFFGADYSQVDISSNGFLSFDVGRGCNRNYNWSQVPIPHGDADCLSDGWGGNPLIAPWFDDLDPPKSAVTSTTTRSAAPPTARSSSSSRTSATMTASPANPARASPSRPSSSRAPTTSRSSTWTPSSAQAPRTLRRRTTAARLPPA